jgi:hypothetical protein
MESESDDLMSTIASCSSFTIRSPSPEADQEFLALRKTLKEDLKLLVLQKIHGQTTQRF